MIDGGTYNPKWNGDPAKYLQGKLKILKHFCIAPTKEELAHLQTLTTQSKIDNGIVNIINNRFDR